MGTTRAMMDGVVRFVARLLLAIFYRSIEVVGAEKIPEAGPLLLVANHGNALVDPALVVAEAPRMPRFLAKHVLFRHPLVRPFLWAAAAIPVYRRQDGVDPRANLGTFARCHDELAAGGVIALFPEGISHHEPRLQPLKTGAARIALEAETERGPLGIRIVPIGLVFEEKERFRSRALIVVGDPFSIEAEAAAAKASTSAARDAARGLTARIAAALGVVTINTTTWEEQRLAGRASEIIGSVDDKERVESMGRDFALRKEVLDTYATLRERDPGRAEHLRARLEQYEKSLRDHGFRDDQLGPRESSFLVRYAIPQVLLLALWAPLALVGSAVNVLPYQFVGRVAARVEDTPDQPATHKVMAGLVLFPLCWAVFAWWVAGKGGSTAGWAAALAMPAVAWFALRYHESGIYLFRRTRTYLKTRANPEAVSALQRERRELRDELKASREIPAP